MSGYDGFDVVETKDDNVARAPTQDVTPIERGSGYYLLRPTSGTIG